MADWDDVRSLALALPDTEEGTAYGSPAWRVHGKLFVLDRALRSRDREELGEAAPHGPILGARVPNLAAKEALLHDDPSVYFTTSHFDGYPMILARLERIDVDELHELIVEAWLARAPKRLAGVYAAAHLPGDD